MNQEYNFQSKALKCHIQKKITWIIYEQTGSPPMCDHLLSHDQSVTVNDSWASSIHWWRRWDCSQKLARGPQVDLFCHTHCSQGQEWTLHVTALDCVALCFPFTYNLQCLSKAEAHLTFSQSMCCSPRYTPKVNVICCQTEQRHHHLGGKKTRFETLFICSVTLLNHLLIENHVAFIHIDAYPAKFNTLCLLPGIWDTEQTTESVAEKQQRSFHCQAARVSGAVYHLSMKLSQKSN